MNIQTENGMGIKPQGIAWKPNYGMGLKTGHGMGLKPSNGMGLSKDQNYFKFDEYARKRKYLQMGSHKPSQPKPKVNNPANTTKANNKNTASNKQANAPIKAAAVNEPTATTSFQARQKWGAAAATINAAAAFNTAKGRGDKYKKKTPETPPPAQDGPFREGQSVGSVKRSMSLFEQLLYV